ncbi:MAG: prepilin-type N-terminal cleavage/methylation domain-containing protein [Bdellovibrionota bacterium]
MHLKKRTFIKYIDSNRGFSLIESLSAIALLAVIVFVFLGWVVNHKMGLNNISQNSEITNTMLRVVSAFGDEDRYCRDIIGPIAFNPTETNGVQIGAIDYYNSIDVKIPNGNVVKIGEPLAQAQGVTTKDIRLKPSVILDAQTVLANLEFTFTKSNVLGPSTNVQKLPVYLTLSAGSILTCSISLAPSLIISNRLCEVQEGGFSHYDPVTKTCVVNDGVKWFVSTDPLKASCPVDFKAATNQKNVGRNKQVCTSVSTVGTKIPPRSYKNGVVMKDNVNIFSAILNPTTSTCKFIFLRGEKPADFKSSIKCISTKEASK